MLRRMVAVLLSMSLLILAGCSGQGTQKGEDQGGPSQMTAETLRDWKASDVPEDLFGREAAAYAVKMKWLDLREGDCFDPEEAVTQKELIQALYQMDQQWWKPEKGQKPKKGKAAFPDVPKDASWQDAVTWSVEWEIFPGFPDGTFRPDAPVSRETFSQILSAYAEHAGHSGGPEGTLPQGDYWDEGLLQERPELAWALEQALLPGVNREIRPGFPVSRLQAAQALVHLAALCFQDPLTQELSETACVPADLRAPKIYDTVRTAVTKAAQKYGATGVQVAILEGGQVADKLAYGWATRPGSGAGDPMTADHKMRVASLSKVVVGMAAMALNEQGTVDLDGELGSYWGVPGRNPAFPEVPITLRSLMTHTSSLALMESTSAKGDAVKSRLASGKGFSGNRPGDIASWGYNNYGFGVLGMTLERAAGKTMDEICKEAFFVPLGIDGSFESGNIQDTNHLVTLYANGTETRSVAMQKGLNGNPAPGTNGVYFAGGFTVSAADLGKMVAVLAGDGCFEGKRILQADSVQAMETPLGTPPGNDFEQCLVLRRQAGMYGRESLYYHTGSAYGVYHFLSYDPATGDGVVVLTTGASGVKDKRGVYAICGEISQAVYQALSNDTEIAPAAPAEEAAK